MSQNDARVCMGRAYDVGRRAKARQLLMRKQIRPDVEVRLQSKKINVQPGNKQKEASPK